MANSITFLHLSDIHFHRWSGDHYDLDNDLRTQLEADLRLLAQHIEEPIDAVLITGDIAFSGKPSEYDVAYEWIKRICEVADCDVTKDVWTIPGNHDFDRDQVAQSTGLQDAHQTLAAADETNIADEIARHCRDPYRGPGLFLPLAAYNNFAQVFGCAIDHKKPFWETKGLYVLDSGIEIRLRGMNSVLVSSNEDKMRDEDGPGTLLLGSFQIPVDEPSVEYITLCHHPLEWLKDEHEIEKKIDKRVRVQLYGHQHEHQITKSEHSVRLVAAAVHPPRGHEPWVPAYNVFQIRVHATKPHELLTVCVYPRIWLDFESEFGSPSNDEFHSEEIELTIDRKGSKQPIMSEQEKEFEERAVEPASETLEMRELTHRYLRLPYYRRLQIAQELDLMIQEDENVPDIEKFRRILARVRDRNLIEEFAGALARGNQAQIS